MTNRCLFHIVKDQKPLVLRSGDTVRKACRSMWERRAGAVLVSDGEDRLIGIFTGRDAVRLLAKGADIASMPLAKAMTRNPVTVEPKERSCDALKAMFQGGFRHVPVTENGNICGIVSRGDLKGMEFEEFRWRAIGQPGDVSANRLLSEIIKRQKPLVLAVSTPVAVACKAMCKRNAGSVLVADKNGRLKGIFTGRDAVRVMAKSSNPAAMPLAKAMTSDPVVLSPDCVAIEALRAMNDGGFRHVPVVHRGEILGVVSRHDFTGVEIDRLDEEEHLKECIW